jgi:hypothetical protein
MSQVQALIQPGSSELQGFVPQQNAVRGGTLRRNTPVFTQPVPSQVSLNYFKPITSQKLEPAPKGGVVNLPIEGNDSSKKESKESVVRFKEVPPVQENDWQDAFVFCDQDGHRSYKKLETRIPGEEPQTEANRSRDVPNGNTSGKRLTIDSDTLNRYKNTYRAGFQTYAGENVSGLTTSEKQLLMGITQLKPIKPQRMYGSQNGGNGWNGWAKNELYFADYLNLNGVGTRPT